MDTASEIASATGALLVRDYILLAAIIALIYLFSFYVYFFPTPLSPALVESFERNKTKPLNREL
jgi:hypothetical protein